MTVRIQNFRIQQPGTFLFSNKLVVSAMCAKSGTSGLALVDMSNVHVRLFVSLSTYLDYLSTETKPKTIVMHPS